MLPQANRASTWANVQFVEPTAYLLSMTRRTRRGLFRPRAGHRDQVRLRRHGT